MAAIIEMPKLSDTMEEGGVAAWLKEVGEEVEEGEPLLEIETDKATMEYSSPEEGVLLKILVEPGKTVALNAPIAVVGEKGEDFDLDALISASAAASGGSQAPSAPAEAPAAAPTSSAAQAAPAAPAASAAPAAAPAASSGGRVKASPLAKKMAAEKGVNLDGLQGSGPNGRIVAADIDSAPAGGVSAVPSSGFGAARADETIPVSMMRKTIAKRLLAGKNDAPHFYLTVSANMEQILDWRARLNANPAVEKGESPKVSVNDLIMMAAGRALRAHPQVNASWQGDSIIQFGGVHISMAVALPSGLVTPVIRDIDRLGVREIAASAKEFGRRARDGALTNEDFQGGTFTISNLGMTSVEEFTAIINPPQACILAVGCTKAVPWVGEDGEIVAQKRMKMTLSSDHRVVDGMVGAKFLETLVAYLENPLNMLE